VHSEVFLKIYIPIIACQFCDRNGDSLYGLMTKDISYNRSYASYIGKTGYQKKSSETTLRWGWGRSPPPPPLWIRHLLSYATALHS